MKKIITLIIAATILALYGTTASAADYSFKAKDTDDFYRPTPYEDAYGSAYNYGGQNVTDFYDHLALPGLISPTPQTSLVSGGLIIDASVPYGIYDIDAPLAGSSDFIAYNAPTAPPAHTPASGLRRSDGSIGTLVIPSLSINMKAYEGTTSAGMSKGVGHFPESSGWNGNVCLAGHNRSSAYAIGAIRNLKIGDTIRYTTVLGTRTYAVTFVGTISSTDWSYLGATSDNRITLITCQMNQPSQRVCIQASAIK